MNGLGDQLLARPGFTGDQHGRIAHRYLLHLAQDAFQAIRCADDVVEAELALQLLAQFAVLLQQVRLLQGVLDPVDQFVRLKGLGQHVVGPLAQGLDGHVHRGVGGDHDYRDILFALLDAL